MVLTKEKFQRYADLKLQIKKIEAELDILQPDIAAELETVDGSDSKVEMDIGSFSFMKKKKWKYSADVAEKTDELKKLKEYEEAEGVASFEENLILQFREKK